MCGIAGFVGLNKLLKEHEGSAVLERMCRVIAHRGPDDQGTFISGAVGLGMRRLSIIDLAGGHQPMSGCDSGSTIVFNGEIYNYRELQSDLKARGHQFRTNSDTEAIIHAYEEYGADCVAQLRGMFAFAIWDERKRQLFIARDRAGKKPLYYTVTASGTILFGSELKSLREHPEFQGNIDPEGLDAYLTFGYIADPLTIFSGVQKLPPGHHLTYKDGKTRIEQYWDFPHELPAEPARSEDDYVDELRSLLDEAVRIRLVADVPLGAFLSGGVDSSTIVGLMARHMTQPVMTFSIGFQEDAYDELKYARLAAKTFGTDHHEFIVTADICDIVDDLVWHFDEPFADSSAIPTYMVSKLAREHVTVVLSGDGGDELFAGYTRYAIDQGRQHFERLPGFVRRGLIKPFSRRLPHGARGRNYLYNVSLDPIERYIDSISVFTNLNKTSLYTDDFVTTLEGHLPAGARYHAYASQVKSGDAIDRLLYLDSKTYLPGDILTKVDRMSMAASLEARVPLLDHKLIEFAGRLPASCKIQGSETKRIFKRAVQGLVPDEILNRPKQGFGVPIAQWISDHLAERIHDTFGEPRTRQRGYFRPEYVDLLLEEHERGRRDHSHSLWALMMFELWHRTFLDSTQPTVLSSADCPALVSLEV